MRLLVLPTLALLAFAPGCAVRPFQTPADRVAAQRCAVTNADLGRRLDKGDWMVRQTSDVWKALAEENVDGQTRPPKHVGYVVRRAYKQARGGPAFHVYEISSLRRDEVLGRIDELGRVTRYEPVRNGTFTERSITSSSLENNVGAILGTTKQITLEPTSERRLAFDALDSNKNGVLEATETDALGSRIAGADRNRDKVVDFAEFDALDAL